MKLFEVSAWYGDTCGNEDEYQIGIVEAESKEAVEAVFNHQGMFSGFKVVELIPHKLPTTIQIFPSERDVKYGRYKIG